MRDKISKARQTVAATDRAWGAAPLDWVRQGWGERMGERPEMGRGGEPWEQL